MILLVVICNLSIAQTATGLMVSQLRSEINPPTPAEANLGSFSGGDVKSFVGSVDVRVPLYEIKIKGLTIPIALNYDNSGIKVNSEASFVGLGWSLGAGGVIVRTQNGFPDDIWRKIVVPTRTEYGFLLDHGQAANNFTDLETTDKMLTYKLGVIDGLIFQKSDGSYWGLSSETPGAKSDTQPDLFTFNFAGKSGKFVFGADQKIKLLNYEPYLLEYTLDNSGNPIWTNNGDPYTSKGITSFKITDEKGVKYTFSELEVSEYRKEGFTMLNAGTSPDGTFFQTYFPVTTAWYLTQIEAVSGELITFTYATEDIKSYSHQLKQRNVQDLTNNSTNASVTDNTNYIKNKRLTSIETPYERITFYPGGRADLHNSQSLSDIQVVSKWNNTMIKQIHFSYSYFESDLNETIWQLYKNSVSTDPYYRLKLTAVSTTMPGDLTDAKYSFLYNEQAPLPAKHSFQQDFWGYYNANHALYMHPKVFVSADLYGQDRFSVLQLKNIGDPQFHVLNGADRNCNPATIALGTLSKIIYPTGGYSEYEYEPHDFIYRGLPFQGGGLRVKKITDYDGVSTANNIVKNYKYIQSSNPDKSSGVLYELPIFAYMENDCAINATSSANRLSYSGSSYDYFQYNTMRVADGMSIHGLGDAVTVGYSEIKEERLGLGYTWSKYATSVQYGDKGDALNDGCTIEKNGFCEGLYEVPAVKHFLLHHWIESYTPEIGPDLNGVDLSPNSYPFISNVNYDWNRGLLLNKVIYALNDDKKSEMKYTYQLFSPETGRYVVNGLYYSNGNNYNIRRTGGSMDDRVFHEWLMYYGKYKIYTNVSRLPLTEEKTDYFAGNQMVTTTKYNYSKRKFVSSSVVNNSSGDTTKVSYRYPFDFSVQPASSIGIFNPISYLVAQNNISTPVEVVTSILRNGQEKIMAAKVAGYSSSFNNIVPIFDAYLQTNTPLLTTDYQKAEIEWDETWEVLNVDPRVKSKMRFSKYDEKANLLEYLVWDIYNSYIWGYNYQYPIASVSNSRYSDIWYENFEALAGTGISANGDSRTGHFSKTNGYTKDLTGLTNGTYTLSYWKKTNNIWSLIIVDDINVVNNVYTINITNTYQVDDVKFFPKQAHMTTYTYEPLIGLTSSTDASDKTTYYEYDSFNHLKNVLDADKSIIKHHEYHFRSQN